MPDQNDFNVRERFLNIPQAWKDEEGFEEDLALVVQELLSEAYRFGWTEGVASGIDGSLRYTNPYMEFTVPTPEQMDDGS